MPNVEGLRAQPRTAAERAEAALGQLLLAFSGTALPDAMAARLSTSPAAGITLFRYLNAVDAQGLRALTDGIQSLAPAGQPFIVAVDHEGGQLIGIGPDATLFAGNMALGAARDTDLTRRVAAAIGRELRALGVNVNYAPVADLATQSANPAVGTRSFGDEPTAVAEHVAATVRGLGDAGIAATLKHYPGGGEAVSDPHLGLPAIEGTSERFDQVELVPFRAGIAAGARLVMTGHPALPGLTGERDLPATLSSAVLRGLLRDELGFEGVAVSDALDMAALPQGRERGLDAVAALAAGQDLLLLPPDDDHRRVIEANVMHAAARGLLAEERMAEARMRVARLRAELSLAEGEPSVVGCADHHRLATELAERSVTLVRDQGGLLPLRSRDGASIGAIMPQPADRTPADTSSSVAPTLASAIRDHHQHVAELVVPHAPTASDIAGARGWALAHDLLIIGSIDASFEPGQAELVQALLTIDVPAVTVALRTPWDLGAYPASSTHVCTYSVHEPSMVALAAALFGERPFVGRLPVKSPTWT